MKTHKTETVTSKVERLVSMTCDLCGKATKLHTWKTDTYETLETTVEMVEGTSYPDSGSQEKTEYHICPECFRGKLMPWLASQGAKPTKAESDW